MADEVEAAETTETVESPAEAENTEAVGGDPGDENEEQPAPAAPGTIPYSRFKQVNEAKKKAEMEMQALREENARLKGMTEARAAVAEPIKEDPAKVLTRKLERAPAGLTEMEQMEWYIARGTELHFPRLVEQTFGMSPQAVQAAISQSTSSHQEQVLARFEAACSARGIDSKSTAIRHAIGAVMDAEKITDFDKAFDAIGIVSKANGNGKKTVVGAGAEHPGVAGELLRTVNNLPKTARDANVMAAAGQKIPHIDLMEILARDSAKG